MTTSPANDNTPTSRPEGYDALVLSYLPLIRRIANSWCSKHPNNGEAADFIQEAIAQALRVGPSYDDRYKFGSWIFFVCRGVIAAHRRSRHVDPQQHVSAPAAQHDYAELSEALRRLSAGRAGDMVVQHAVGHDYREIGEAFGVSRQRAHQIISRERAALRRRMAMPGRVAA